MSANVDPAALPLPFSQDTFDLHRRGVFDDPAVDVYLNRQSDFAYLSPQPHVDYVTYRPRSQRLSLEAYRARNEVIERRFAKIANWFTNDVHDVLEIGASDGAFLGRLREQRPDVGITCIEPDLATVSARGALAQLQQFESLADANESGSSFDRICLFHVLEHITEPSRFLDECRALLRTGGYLIIEVPSLEDPLLSLYESAPYEAFYFQAQHPYVYSSASLARLLETNGFLVEQVLRHQRYGLENHLTWLARERPGGDEHLRKLFSGCDANYRQALEEAGNADAVIAIARSSRQS